MPCPRRIVRSVNCPYESWKLYFPNEFVVKIVEFTNIWIKINKGNHSREKDTKETNIVEMHAIFGLLISCSSPKINPYITGRAVVPQMGLVWIYFSANMSLNRFKFLLRATRFDDITQSRLS